MTATANLTLTGLIMALSMEQIQEMMRQNMPDERVPYFTPEEEGGYLLELTRLYYKNPGHTQKVGFMAVVRIVESTNPWVTAGAQRSVNFWCHNEGWEKRLDRFLEIYFPDHADRQQLKSGIRTLGSGGLPPEAVSGRRAFAYAAPITSKGGTQITEVKWIQPAPRAGL